MDEQIQALLGGDGAAVYRDVQQELAAGNTHVAKAAGVGAALFAAHAVAWAERESRVSGRKATAQDYLETVAIEANAIRGDAKGFPQAAMYKWRKQDFKEFVERVLEKDPDTMKSFYRLDDGRNQVDVPASNIVHIQEGAHQHPLTVSQYLDLANNILDNIKAAGIARRQKNRDCLTVAAHIGGKISDYAAILFFYPNQRVLLGTVMPKAENAAAAWLKERGSHALHELSRGVASNPLSISSIQANAIVVKHFQEIENNKTHLQADIHQGLNEHFQGQFSVLQEGKRLVHLFEAADESTFLHEMAHVFYDDMERLAPRVKLLFWPHGQKAMMKKKNPSCKHGVMSALQEDSSFISKRETLRRAAWRLSLRKASDCFVLSITDSRRQAAERTLRLKRSWQN